MDEMPVENKQAEQKKKPMKKVKPADGFDIEIGSLLFTMGDVDLEIKDVKVRDMEEFKRFIFEVLSQ